MTLKELRSSAEYENAYAEYIKSEDDREVRRLLTELGTASEGDSASVPIPVYVEDRIRTAWNNNTLLQHVRRTNIPGVLSVGFESSSTGASVHTEGADAPTEEQLVVGVAQLIPKTMKKWIRISTEVEELKGRAFLDYIYDEITYQIIRGIANEAINSVTVAPAQSSEDAVGVPSVTAAPSATTIFQAEGLLSDEAQNIFVVMNRQTWAAFKSITTGDGYPLADPFDGATVIFSDALPAYSTANNGNTYAIVGDLDAIQVNFPAGEDVKFKFDDLSLAEQDLVKIVGRLSYAAAVTAPGRLAKIVKPQA